MEHDWATTDGWFCDCGCWLTATGHLFWGPHGGPELTRAEGEQKHREWLAGEPSPFATLLGVPDPP